MVFLIQMDILDPILGSEKTVNIPDIGELDLGRVLGPVLATGDKKLWSRGCQSGDFRVVGHMKMAFMDRQATFAVAAPEKVG